MQRQAATAQPCQPPNHHNLNKPKQIHVAQLPLPNHHNLTSRQSPNPPKTPTPPQSPTPQSNPTTQPHNPTPQTRGPEGRSIPAWGNAPGYRPGRRPYRSAEGRRGGEAATTKIAFFKTTYPSNRQPREASRRRTGLTPMKGILYPQKYPGGGVEGAPIRELFKPVEGLPPTGQQRRSR